MKYVSIDIETTGLDETWCQILEIGAVFADTLDFTTPVDQLPYYKCRFYYDHVVGQPYALWLNAELIKDMEKRPSQFNYIHPDTFWSDFTQWLWGLTDEKLSMSGKNYGTFDSRFLWQLPRWNREYFSSRVIDPAILFAEPDDVKLPDLKTCIARAGLQWDESKHHRAVEDARMVVELNRVGLKRLWRNRDVSSGDSQIISGQAVS